MILYLAGSLQSIRGKRSEVPSCAVVYSAIDYDKLAQKVLLIALGLSSVQGWPCGTLAVYALTSAAPTAYVCMNGYQIYEDLMMAMSKLRSLE